MKFLVTEESGRLARWLRLCGYDTLQMPAQPFSELYRRAFNESRIVVTRNERVRAGCLFRVVHLHSQELDGQLRQLMQELGLPLSEAQAFTRCDVCNVAVEPIDKPLVKDRVPPYVFQTQARFHRCPSCHRIYWAATHWQRACLRFSRLRRGQTPSRETRVGYQTPPEEHA
jgi:hypothetical protein